MLLKTKIILCFLCALWGMSSTGSAQNILQLNKVQATANDTVQMALSVSNDSAFVSFQCDVILPAGFQYVPNSIQLTKRGTDHVVSASVADSNSLRIIAYSPNNTAFLNDTGNVAFFRATTPADNGTYPVPVKNAILGNSRSQNVLDSLVNGEIILSPLGIPENDLSKDEIQCFPNPFHQNIILQFKKEAKPEKLEVFDTKGILLITHHLTEAGRYVFSATRLLGKNPVSGNYFVRFSFMTNNRKYTVVKKIQFQHE